MTASRGGTLGVAVVACAVLLGLHSPAAAQIVAPKPRGAVPTATLAPAPALSLSGGVDSNSPAVWDLVDGVLELRVLTSTAGRPSIESGRRLSRLGPAEPVAFLSHPGHGVWMESVVVDDGGTWYGYYHNEIPAYVCDRPDLTLPRIGAARSRDQGETWEDLGILIEAPPGWHDCATPNQYFVGGVGDVSVMLDQDSRDLYLFFSQYSRYPAAQGVAVARLEWADRDAPVGKVAVWVDGIWQHPDLVRNERPDGEVASSEWVYPAGTPLVPVTHPWHDADPVDDAFWGASVHWNLALQRYVMLLNRTKDEQFNQEGVYVSFAPTLDDPTAWSPPVRILEGGIWYPQVMGLEPGEGSDTRAGARARFFMGGKSNAFIEFAYR